MVVYRHKTWLKKANFLIQSKYFAGLKLLGLFLGLFTIIFVFGLKITTTINKGLETQRRTDRIAAEVQALEEENKKLTYMRDLYKSDTEIEAQYRELESKKKSGETVYMISLPEKKNGLANVSQEGKLHPPSLQFKNWEIWVQNIFQ